jgi:hypothetical protein
MPLATVGNRANVFLGSISHLGFSWESTCNASIKGCRVTKDEWLRFRAHVAGRPSLHIENIITRWQLDPIVSIPIRPARFLFFGPG